jgi:hypothetical protein
MGINSGYSDVTDAFNLEPSSYPSLQLEDPAVYHDPHSKPQQIVEENTLLLDTSSPFNVAFDATSNAPPQNYAGSTAELLVGLDLPLIASQDVSRNTCAEEQFINDIMLNIDCSSGRQTSCPNTQSLSSCTETAVERISCAECGRVCKSRKTLRYGIY